MDAKINGWLVALMARHGRENVRVHSGMIEVRGTARNGASVWHSMAKVI